MPKAIYQLPNIFVTYKTASSPNPAFNVPRLLSEFLLVAAKRKPSWEFKTEVHALVNGATFSAFAVVANGQRIGGVSYSSRGSVYGISLECDAIAAANQRGRHKWSSKPKVALDTFKKFFKEYSPEQNLARIRSAGNGKFAGLVYNPSMQLSRVGDELDRHVRSFTTPLTEEHKQALRILDFPEQKIEELQTNLVDYLFAREQHCMAEKGLAVYEHVGVYYVRVGDAHAYDSYRNDNLPHSIGEKLGLLKLVDRDTVVPNVGYRISDTEFYILPEEENVREEAA